MNWKYKRGTVVALVAALALGLAACGGGDDEPDTGMNGGGEPTMPPEPPPPANLTALFAAAQEASGDAAMAGKDAMDAEMAAKEGAMMLTTTEVAGESMKAMMSAQAILDAKDDAAQAVMDAEAAMAAAEKAEMDAMEVADDHPQKSALDAAIEAAIEAAKAQVEAATKVRDGTTIKNAVTEVTGGPQGKGTPRSIANSVGADIAAALATGTTRGGTRIAYGATAPVAADVPAALRHTTDDHKGMTWAMIVGEDKVMMERLGTGNTEVPVGSIAGMTPGATWASVPNGITVLSDNDPTTSDTATDGANFDTAMYKGIPGTVYCLGKDCKVTDGKLSGSWYFSPTSPMAYYQKMNDDPDTSADESQMYEAEVLYASYGHWLTVDTSGATPLWTVNTFANFAGTNAADVTTVGNETNKLADKATYSGMAAGMSVRKMGSGDSATTDSGRFTAEVMLTASFGGTPTVRGKIDKFMGDAVGSGWSVNLESATLGTTSNDGVATGTGRDGVWSATAYGTDSTARPVGILGGFTAHFSDGDAAGAFTTRMDEE